MTVAQSWIQVTDKCNMTSVVSVVSSCISHVRVDKLSASVAGEHVDNDDLPPLLHVHQQVAQLAVVLVDEINPLGAHLQESMW
ncbi:hypothetical protein E2C01_010266 [Portunus trituberculatus]|uniref:Uncharacterized protein n=1 Tax=Portunus trituberculatus TaxID=210409 RepID=A0A5B7D7W9_PORTR|nr:hypothetical protein [Portunus trituberculatus]